MARQALSPLIIALVIVGIIGSGIFIYYQMSKDLPSPQPQNGGGESPNFEPEPEATPEPDLQLPELDASDAVIRSLVEQISEHPQLARWVVHDGLVRRFVAAVDSASRGESPKVHVPFVAPQAGFQAQRQGDTLVIADDSFGRYDVLTQVVLSLDTATAVRLYRQLEPLFDEAYQDLGYPGGSFDDVMQRSIDQLLQTPIPEGDVAVTKALRSYRFSDPSLEDLSPIQKHYLRLGADNMRQLNAKLRLMATTLELSEDENG